MTYRERLWVPALYWVVAATFGVSSISVLGFYGGPVAALASGLVTAAGAVVTLLVIGGATITVHERGVTVNRSLLEWPYVGEVSVLDAEATRRRLGVDADVRAFLVQRPYVPGAVEIAVEDPADPHPYWLVSTRHPAELAVAIAKARPRRAGAGGQDHG